VKKALHHYQNNKYSGMYMHQKVWPWPMVLKLPHQLPEASLQNWDNMQKESVKRSH
jgi:hypothetical protein